MRGKILIQGSIIRALYGKLALFLPRQLFASVGLKGVDDDARYLNRLFGGRDIIIAAATVAAVRRGDTREATALNMACELTDSLALVEELRTGQGLRRSLVIGIAFNIVGWATWIRALLARPVPEAPGPEPAGTGAPAGQATA